MSSFNLSQLTEAACLAIVPAMAAPLSGNAQTGKSASQSILGDWGVSYINSREY
mgnify:CR=1 FL=1